MSDKETDIAKVSSVEESLDIQVDEQKMTRKLDLCIMPLLFVTYALQFMDKLALSSSSVFGIRQSNHLVGQQYSWVSSVFYFGFMLGQFPMAWILQKMPIGKVVGALVAIWGLTLALTALCDSYGGLVTARFFLGLFESSVSPAAIFISAMYYTPEQVPLRTGIWFAGNDLGGILSGFITYGLGHIKGLPSWKYIFIVYGSVTFLWGGVVAYFLPDSPATAKFLTPEEKEFFRVKRVQATSRHPWKWSQVKECLLDVQIWLLVAITITNILPNGGMISYGFIIVGSFGYNSFNTSLLTVPAGVIAWIAIVFTGWVCSKYPNWRCYIIALLVIPSLIGSIMIYAAELQGCKLAGYYLLSVQPATFPNVLAMVSSNYRGSTKRVTIGAIIFIIYCASNIAAPQLFRHNEYPKYSTAYQSWIASIAITILLAFITRFYLIRENKKKDAALAAQDKDDESVIAEDLDITDKQDLKFKYLY